MLSRIFFGFFYNLLMSLVCRNIIRKDKFSFSKFMERDYVFIRSRYTSMYEYAQREFTTMGVGS